MTEGIKIDNVGAFGKAIRAERKRLGYTQAQLAKFCGLSVTYLSKLENGKQTAEFGKAIRIGRALGIDLFARKR